MRLRIPPAFRLSRGAPRRCRRRRPSRPRAPRSTARRFRLRARAARCSSARASSRSAQGLAMPPRKPLASESRTPLGPSSLNSPFARQASVSAASTRDFSTQPRATMRPMRYAFAFRSWLRPPSPHAARSAALRSSAASAQARSPASFELSDLIGQPDRWLFLFRSRYVDSGLRRELLNPGQQPFERRWRGVNVYLVSRECDFWLRSGIFAFYKVRHAPRRS